MMLQSTKVAGRLHDNLGELRRRAELESLRPFVIESGCFLPTANTDTASITMEELKKLARAWKLHERRNFWKNHPDIISMVDALLQFIVDTKRVIRTSTRSVDEGGSAGGGGGGNGHAWGYENDGNSNHENDNDNDNINGNDNSAGTSFTPAPPLGGRPSRSNNNNSSKSIAPPGSLRMRQIYGLNYFNREVTDKELALHSRFFKFPMTNNENSKALEIDDSAKEHSSCHIIWTDTRKERIKADLRFIHALENSVTASSIAAKKAKHLNLAQHLVTFSSAKTKCCDISQLPCSSISTFLSVSETDDSYTATCSLIALSNICSMPHVRSYIVDNNLLHRITNIIPLVNGPSATLATSLLFYYFSCDAEIEDRVYNTGGAYISANGVITSAVSPEKDESNIHHIRKLQILSLKTLVNLMPCGDRLRVTEVIMRIIHVFVQDDIEPGSFDCNTFDRTMAIEYLPLLLSVSSFTNTHATLLSNDIFDLLAKTSIYCCKMNDIPIAILTSQLLLSFLQVLESHVTHDIVSEDNYIFSYEKLMELYNEDVLSLCMHGIRVMSGIKELATYVCESEILAVVSHTIFSWETLPHSVSLDAAIYFCNVCQNTDSIYLRRLVVEDKIALSLMALMSKSIENFHAQQIAIKALQNILSCSLNCIDLCITVLSTLVRMIELHHDLGAAKAIYNISCCEECLDTLQLNQIHIKVLDLYTKTNDLHVREIYLSIICQLFFYHSCVDDLVGAGLVEILSQSIINIETKPIWSIAVKIALNVVNSYSNSLTEDQRLRIVNILKVVCIQDSNDDIIGKAAVVLAYISLTLEDFSEVDTVLRAIMHLSSKELVVESVSIILYNLTCSEKNSSILVKDSVYINIMINIMRSGLPETQMNIAKAMRTLCSLEVCTELLMKSSSLSDLIVIALLRSSSDDIKVVCSQAFYNMLTHDSLREQMLSNGDLYWAITRICKNESIEIRLSAAKALLDLSINAENYKILRQHHVFSFIQEITVNCQADIAYIDICIRAIQNFCLHFETNFILYELTSLILICTDAISRCKNLFTIRVSLLILVNISIQCTTGWDKAFFDNVDISTTLSLSRHIWATDMICRESVAALLWNLTKSSILVKSFNLTVLNPVLKAVYIANDTSITANTKASDKIASPSEDMCENLLGVLLHFISLSPSPPSQSSVSVSDSLTEEVKFNAETDRIASKKIILNVDICFSLIYDAFGVGPNSTCSSVPFKGSCQVFAMTILAYIVSELHEHEHAATTTATATDTGTDTGTGTDMNVQLTSRITQGIVNTFFLNDPSTCDNVKVIILELSKHSTSAAFLLDSKVFTLLLQQLRSFKTTNESYIRYISACLRNISMHPELVPRLVCTPDLDTLIRYMLDTSTNEDLCYDVSILLFNCQAYMLKNEYIINSEFVLETCSKLMSDVSGGISSSSSSSSKDGDNNYINQICNYIIGEILEKYSTGIHVSPDFVQSMFVEMTHGNSSVILHHIQSLKPRNIKHIVSVFHAKDIHNKHGIIMPYYRATGSTEQWKPFLIRDRKKMITDMLDSKMATSMKYEQRTLSTTVSSSSHMAWNKITEEHARILLPDQKEVINYFENEQILGEEEKKITEEENMLSFEL